MIAEPPSLAGIVQLRLTWALPPSATTSSGGEAGATGVIGPATEEKAESPTALVEATWNS